MIKSCTGLLVLVLSPLGLAAQQVWAGNQMLPEAPRAQTTAAFSDSASAAAQTTPPPTEQTQPPQQTAPPPQQTAPPAQQTNPPAETTNPSTEGGTPPPSGQTQAQTEEQRRIEAERELKQEESQRMLGVIPNFNTVISGQAAPITSREKFQLFFKSSVDPFQFVAAGVDALIEQGEDSYPEYHQGFEGYAKRYGAAFTDSFDGNFWGNAVLPSLLHQDPRYFRLGHGTVVHRILYSVSTTVRTKGDNGKWQPNYSNLAGNFIGGAISNAYYPASDRGVGLTLERGLTVSAEGVIGSLAVEFYPDVIQHYRRRRALRQQQQAGAAGAATTAPAP